MLDSADSRTTTVIFALQFPVRYVLCTEDFKQATRALEKADLVFEIVENTHIVDLPWHTWDMTKDPPHYPAQGNPANYVLERPHSESLAHSIGKIWKITFPITTHVECAKHEGRGYIHMIKPGTWSGNHIFEAQNQGFRFASEQGKDFLDEHAKDWIEFKMLHTESRVARLL